MVGHDGGLISFYMIYRGRISGICRKIEHEEWEKLELQEMHLIQYIKYDLSKWKDRVDKHSGMSIFARERAEVQYHIH